MTKSLPQGLVVAILAAGALVGALYVAYERGRATAYRDAGGVILAQELIQKQLEADEAVLHRRIKVLTASVADARSAVTEAERNASEVRERVVVRVARARQREAEIVAQPPSAAGARASLVRARDFGRRLAARRAAH